MSISTGVAPTTSIAATVATAVCDTVTTLMPVSHTAVAPVATRSRRSCPARRRARAGPGAARARRRAGHERRDRVATGATAVCDTGISVVTVSHTAVATVAAIEVVGATPVLIDIEPQYY